ncbi:MAG: serine/threonine protein kinase [Armatimonadota bacterium]
MSYFCTACGTALPVTDPGDLPVHTRLHHDLYVIEGVLGHGGFSVTYLATHRDLKQRVAIKEFFPTSLASRDPASGHIVPRREMRDLYRRALERVIREGQIMARFDHRGIVRVHNLFQERNTAYLVMELIEGHTLAEVLCRRGKLPEGEVRELTGQLVDALGALHDHDICHLDIKASNVMLTPAGRAVLLDFGAARQLIASSTGETSIRFGSPNYAPLEVINGEETGPESDLFELGMLLHEMLTGSRPPTAQQRAYRDAWTPEHLPEPWRRLCAGALQLNRTARPADIRAWWEGTESPDQHADENEQATAITVVAEELPPTEVVSPRSAVATIVVPNRPSEHPTDVMPEPGTEPATEVMTPASAVETVVVSRPPSAQPAEAPIPSPDRQDAEMAAQTVTPDEVPYWSTSVDVMPPPRSPASPWRPAHAEPAPAVLPPTSMILEPEKPSPVTATPLPDANAQKETDLPDLPVVPHAPEQVMNTAPRTRTTAPADTGLTGNRRSLRREETTTSGRSTGNRLAGVLLVLLLAAVAFAVFSYLGKPDKPQEQTAPATSSPAANHSGAVGKPASGATPGANVPSVTTTGSPSLPPRANAVPLGTGQPASGKQPQITGDREVAATQDEQAATDHREVMPPRGGADRKDDVTGKDIESSQKGGGAAGTAIADKPDTTEKPPSKPPVTPPPAPATKPFMAQNYDIDESKGVVYARGIGTIPTTGKSEYLRIESAKTAALVKAQKHLAQALKGASIDEPSSTTIETVSGHVPPYTVISEQKLDARTYEVVIKAALPR